MKKLKLITTASLTTAISVVMVVSCRVEAIVQPKKSEHLFEVTYNLNEMTPENIFEKMTNASEEFSEKINQITMKYSSKIIDISTSNTKNSEMKMKQAILDFVYELGEMEFKESVSYNGVTQEYSTYKVDYTERLSYEKVKEASHEQLAVLYMEFVTDMLNMIENSVESTKKFVASQQYKDWLEDYVITPNLDTTDLHLMSFQKLGSDWSLITVYLPINPTEEEIDEFYDEMLGAFGNA